MCFSLGKLIILKTYIVTNCTVFCTVDGLTILLKCGDHAWLNSNFERTMTTLLITDTVSKMFFNIDEATTVVHANSQDALQRNVVHKVQHNIVQSATQHCSQSAAQLTLFKVQHNIVHKVQHNIVHKVQHNVVHKVQHNIVHKVQHNIGNMRVYHCNQH